jgi:exodeoxyribonuclease V gamma subunit
MSHGGGLDKNRGIWMSLQLHIAPHPDALVDKLIDQLAVPPEDPFAPELIAVPTRGIERWLTQRIALGFAGRGVGDGVVANVEFPSPRHLVQQVLAAVPDLAASANAWQTDNLTSHVLTAIDRHLDEPWLRLIQRYVTAGESNRLGAATKVARLFSTYARRRPEMILAWADGADVGPAGDPIDAGHAWQPRLWRAVRDEIAIPPLAGLLPEGLDPIRDGSIDLDLPQRLAVYGLTATDPLDLQVLQALGEQREVTLYALHPSPGLWQTLAGDGLTVTSRDDDPTAAAPVHPLLGSWGRDSRELQTVLSDAGLTGEATSPASARPNTLLARIQDDIHTNRPVSFDPDLAAAVTAGDDRSVQIHVTYGPRRQVEVTRDVILHLLAGDPTLEPRDVVIMTPDLGTFAPLLEAAFPAGGHTDTDAMPDLRLRIADRSPAAVNPLVRFAATVLELADSRLEANTIRELVTRPVVQQRFGFDLDTAAAITGIIKDSNISWGLDADHREQWGAGHLPDRTWSRGLDRALTGVFYSDDPVRVIDSTVPLDGVEGQEATPVGLLAALIDRIVAIRDLLAGLLPMSQWAEAIADSVRLLAAPAWDAEWQLGQLERLLAETFPETTPDPALSLAEARRATAGWTETRPSPLHFRTGDVTVCTLVPMRSVPYRVVCLLGMDDERFPRSSRHDGDDLLVGDERVGDFDRSAEDRQLLLDAVMATGDHLVVTYSGRDQLTNSELPPAVPIAELRDTLYDMAGAGALDQIETVHPLQSFSDANFTPGALHVPGPFGFDPVAFAGANAIASGPGTVVAGDWPPPEPLTTLELDDLVKFLQHPVQRFMQARLGFTVPKAGETPDDTLPADLDPLSKWALKEGLLDGIADGYPLDALQMRRRADDTLPPGALGDGDLADAIAAATALWDGALERDYDRHRMRTFPGSVHVGAVTLQGRVLGNPDHAHLARVTASTVKAKHRIQAFVELVFLSAIEPDVAWESFLLGRHDPGHLAVTIGPIGADADERRSRSLELLADLVALFTEGMCRPLPLPCESAYAWQRNVGTQRGKAFGKAAEVWERDRFNPEAEDPAHVLAFGAGLLFRDLLATGFEEYCARLWAPILPMMREQQF